MFLNNSLISSNSFKDQLKLKALMQIRICPSSKQLNTVTILGQEDKCQHNGGIQNNHESDICYISVS